MVKIMRINLETNRLLLRPFQNTDLNDFYLWASDSEVTKYLTWQTHKNLEVSKMILDKWIQEYEEPKRINFAICLKKINKVIGQVDVINYEGNIPVLGYVSNRNYWNNGYMSEAVNKVIEYLFNLGYEKIKIEAMVENIGSNKVIQKCGGVFYGTRIHDYKLKNEKRVINEYYITKKQ